MAKSLKELRQLRKDKQAAHKVVREAQKKELEALKAEEAAFAGEQHGLFSEIMESISERNATIEPDKFNLDTIKSTGRALIALGTGKLSDEQIATFKADGYLEIKRTAPPKKDEAAPAA